jgi:hypothetical protein
VSILAHLLSALADRPSFAVSLREFQGEEGADAELFADEKEAAAAAKAQEERERAVAVPGLLKVSSELKFARLCHSLISSLPQPSETMADDEL